MSASSEEIESIMMASTALLLLQLLLLASLVSASHHWGGNMNVAYKGRNPDGSFKLSIRSRATYDSCDYNHYWYCYEGNCGSTTRRQSSRIDSSTNTPSYKSQWCESETIESWSLSTDKPVQLRAASCCWISTRNSVTNWRLNTLIDLGTRSDTREPNRSPNIAILPFIRVPQNCPRTYKLPSFDPDGDHVRCRYGNVPNMECDNCYSIPGFHLDQDSCKLHYQSTSDDFRVFAFEMVVEDFPRSSIDLFYSDGSKAQKPPLTTRMKRQAVNSSFNTGPPSTGPTTADPVTTGSWGLRPSQQTTTTSAMPATNTPFWRQWETSSTSTVPTATKATLATQKITTSTTLSTRNPTTPTATTTSTTPTMTSTTPTTITSTTPTTTTSTTPTTTTSTTPTTTTSTTPTTTTSTTPTTTTSTTPTTTTSTTSSITTSTSPPFTNTMSNSPATTADTTTLLQWVQTTTTSSRVQTTAHQKANSSPFSKLPLQFALLVDPAVPSCQEGVYLPQFVAPTPADGERIIAEVQKELEIRIKAQATHSLIDSLILSGPANITKHRDTNNEFTIRWTPVEDNLGEYYPVCFAVESAKNATKFFESSVYQSEMRCVLVEIRKQQIEATVTCTESTMKVEVEKSSFFGLQEDHLRLSDPSNTICSLERHSNSTHIVAIIPLNECGTQIEEDDDYLIFKNEITTTSDAPNALITRKHLVEARFYCQYPKRGNVTLSFSAHRKKIDLWEKGFGSFSYQFEFFQENQYRSTFNPNSYPLEFDIGDRIYMQLNASSSVNNTEMFVESCRAAPYDNPNYHPTYSIIDNGCKVDPTVQIYSTPSDRQFRFSMEAFKFIGLHDQVYISCTVMMCEAGNPNTRCSQGCVNSTFHNVRGKRNAVVESGKHFVSQGPLRLRREADPRGGSAFSLNLNLVFVAGCLLVAVGMVSGVLVYKSRTSRVKYQPLPAYEN